MKKLMTRLLSLSFALGLGVAAAGCDEYSYYDIHVRFDNGTLPTTLASEIQFCRVTVTGADSSVFRIMNCPPSPTQTPAGDVGIFTYSTFADEGKLTFKLDAFTSRDEKPTCITGTGMVTVDVGKASPVGGTPLLISKSGESCASITPQQ